MTQITISFDLDHATGDCSGGAHACCAWQCDWCGQGPQRAEGNAGRWDALARFARMRNWLMTLDIIEPIVVRDCHADIVDWLQPGDTVLNWDEHSDDDCYCEDDLSAHFTPLDCGNWVTCARNKRIRVAQMCELPFPEIGVPVQLFIAVSVPYTSPVCDGALLEMLAGMGRVDFDLGPI